MLNNNNVSYRSNLHALATRERKRSLELATSASSSVNYRYLTSPEMKTRLHSTKNETRALKLRLKRLESKLSELVERNGVILEEELSADMCKLMDENDSQVQEEYKEDTFHNIFWKQQREAMGREGVKRNGI